MAITSSNASPYAQVCPFVKTTTPFSGWPTKQPYRQLADRLSPLIIRKQLVVAQN
jgi:hypothetical protein